MTFAYDALGRRTKKTYRGQTTRWIWDGNVPLHEWVEGELEPPAEVDGVPLLSASEEAKKRDAALEELLALEPRERGTEKKPITWVFEPESFAPMAKLYADRAFLITCDHLGTPVLMTEGDKPVWNAAISVYGELRNLDGQRHACPFRWPGQYEDAETGLYYNRFRYYDPEAGQYCCADPIRLRGGTALYAYVYDPLTRIDPLGLTGCPAARRTAPRTVEHASQRGARRAALREAGIPAGTPPARSLPSNPGSQAATGARGTRGEWDPVSDANVGVHHDPNGHLFPDGSTIPPHYGVDVPGAPTVHHTYPSGNDPRLNR